MTKSKSEEYKFKKRYVLFWTLIILLISIVFFRPSVDKILIASIVGLAYFTGIISLFFGIIFSVFGYFAAMPIISTVYAYIAFILAKIHYIIFKVFMNKTMRRMEWYRKTELRVKNNTLIKKIIKTYHEFLLSMGIDRSRRVKFFEVAKCKACKKDVPTDGSLCPYCGEKTATD